MPPEKANILVVDDDPSILSLIQDILEFEGYKVMTADNGKTALKVFTESQPSLVLLDIMLPDIDGYTVCRHIRQTSQIPIIMITAKDREEEEIVGLDAGADDYITKPFSPGQLAAHVRAVIRRSSPAENPILQSIFRCYDLRIDFPRQIVTNGKERIALTNTEYKILAMLALYAGKIVSPHEILKEIWDKDNRGSTHILQVNINRLRHKLQSKAGKFEYIETRPGQGYLLKTPN